MSAYSKTLKDCQDDVALQQVSGVGSCSSEFIALLNEAQETLARRGGWFDTEQSFTMSIRGCHLVFPEFVGTILGVRGCGGLASVQDQWFSFASNDYGASWGGGYGGYGGYEANGGINGAFNGVSGYGSRTGNRLVIENAGTRPTYNEITGIQGKQIRYVVKNSNDVGKKLTIFGKKFGDYPLQEKNENGATINGLTLTANSQTTDFVTEIGSVIREETEGMGYLYAYDPATGILQDLAYYMPHETHPRYRCSKIIGNGFRNLITNVQSGGDCDEHRVQVEVLVKLRCLPLKHPNDFLLISNFRALKLALQAVKLEQANEDLLAQAKWLKAIAELNFELDDKLPKRQTPARMNLGRRMVNPI